MWRYFHLPPTRPCCCRSVLCQFPSRASSGTAAGSLASNRAPGTTTLRYHDGFLLVINFTIMY